MKKTKAMLWCSAMIFGLGTQAFSQEVMPEVTLTAVRYKYLNAVNQKEAAQPVKMLQRTAAEYNVKNTDYYEDDYGMYFVSFYIPEGEILAAYDKDGKLLRTAEKYKDVAVPDAVRNAVRDRYPQ